MRGAELCSKSLSAWTRRYATKRATAASNAGSTLWCARARARLAGTMPNAQPVLLAPYQRSVDVTPHAADAIDTNSRPCDALFVGVAGDINVRLAGNSADAVFTLPAGAILTCAITHVRASSTTAGQIKALWT